MAVRSLAKYPEYKETGLEWFGETPAHWSVMRTDSLFHVKNTRVQADDMSESEVFHFSIPNVQQTGTGAIEDGNTVDSDKVLIESDALLVSKLNPRKGVVCKAAPKAGLLTVASSEFVQLEARGVELDWAYRLYQSENIRSYLSSIVQSATRSHQRAAPSQIAKLWIVVPSADEQRAIAAFLDGETAKIDTLIAKKEKLIELLAEKRTALITRAVTKGLDPNVPMKDSGVEWLGEVPEHWSTCKMRYVATPISGGTPDKGNREYWDGTIPWVSPKDMKRRKIDDSIDHVTEAALRYSGLKLIEPPAILIVVRGMILAHSFPVGMTTRPVTINQDMKALVLDEKTIPTYFLYMLEGMRAAVLSLVEESGHGTKKLRSDLWASQLLFIPGAVEQELICEFLDRETARIDTLTEKVCEAIDRLKEYRTALISAAVTGKIDVRDAA